MRTTLVHSGSSASLASFFGGEDKNPEGIEPDGRNPETTRDPAEGSFLKSALRNKTVNRLFPILTWSRGYTMDTAIADLVAGITVGLTVLPQGLAYATVAGLPAIYGLYSSFIGCFVYLFMGGTRNITVGPSAINCVLTRKYVYGKSPDYAVFLCFVTGVLTFLMSTFHLAFITNFVSVPVNSAFTTGVSLTIVATQMKSLLGINYEGEGFIPAMKGLFENIDNIRKWDSIMSASCCAVFISLSNMPLLFTNCRERAPKFFRIVSTISTARGIIVIGVSTFIVSRLGPDQPFSLVGNIPAGLPPIRPPPFSIYEPADNRTHTLSEIMSEEASAFLVLPVLSAMGHMSIAKALSDGERVDATQETLVVGITNLISCFFSSMPIAGSLSRSTVNYISGVKTPLGGLYTGIIVILALQFLTPYFYFIPKPSLGAVIVCSVFHMVDAKIILSLWRCKRMDLVPWVMTFLVTTTVGIDMGILTGIMISASFLLYYAARPRVKILKGETSGGTQFIIVNLDRSLTFPSVDYISYEIMKSAKIYGDSIPIIVDCHHIQFADFTAAEAIRDLVRNLRKQGYCLIFHKMKPSVERIVASAMNRSNIPFILRQTPEELEFFLETGNIDNDDTKTTSSHH